jgi:AraC family transcriptional activator of pobA
MYHPARGGNRRHITAASEVKIQSVSENRTATQQIADEKRYSEIIDRYLSECYDRRQTARVNELAALLDASRPYLSRMIPQVLGKPLKQLLVERQMAQAHRLLTETNLSVADVALACGCGTVSTLYRRFVEVYDATPASVRERTRR